MARLSASVPPLVKMTSLGRAPKTSASCSRDSSTTRRARRPAECSDDGLPSWASSSVIAAMACGRIGVVAAWSRYTGVMASDSLELFTLADLFQQLRDDLEQVADHAEVGQLEDGCLRVLVDGDDGLRGLHAGPVLDGAGNADRHVQLRRDRLAGLAPLELMRILACVGHRAGRADRRAERVGQLLDQHEALRAARAAPAGHHNRRLGQ